MTKKTPKTTTAPPPASAGTRLTTDQGEQLLLGPRLFGGGEGDIHEVVGHDHKVIKLYHPQHRTPDREAKLRVMLAQTPRDDMQRIHGHPSLAWPERIVYDNGRFIGYGMARVIGAWPLVEVYNPLLRAQKGRSFNWGVLYHAAANLAKAVNALHYHGYVVGDLNQGNLLVNKDALITLVDTDSFQVREGRSGRVFYSKVGTADFTPPELYGKQLATTARTLNHDAFGLAVMIFMILMEGNHPFTGYPRSGAATGALVFQDNIRSGLFPYDPTTGYEPPPGAPPFAMLPPDLQLLFREAFVNTHQAPGARPMPLRWAKVLDESNKLLIRCRVDPNHIYANHQATCPWCERAARHAAAARPPGNSQPLPASSAQATAPQQTAPQPAGNPTPATGPSAGAVFLFIILLLALIGFVWWLLMANGLL